MIALSIGYYFIVASPKIEQEKRNQEKIELLNKTQIETEKLKNKQQQSNNQEECLDSAKSDKENSLKLLLDWANSEEGKTRIKNENLNLSSSFDEIDKIYKQTTDQCYRKYPKSF